MKNSNHSSLKVISIQSNSLHLHLETTGTQFHQHAKNSLFFEQILLILITLQVAIAQQDIQMIRVCFQTQSLTFQESQMQPSKVPQEIPQDVENLVQRLKRDL